MVDQMIDFSLAFFKTDDGGQMQKFKGNPVHQVESTIQSVDGQDIPIIKNASLTMLNGRQHLEL